MRRIDAILKVKDKLTEMFDRKAARILRGVDQAIACAKDDADEARDAAKDIMEKLGNASAKDQTANLQSLLNDYNDKIQEAKAAEEAAANFEELKKTLLENVEVED